MNGTNGILAAAADGIGVVTFHQPEKHNAMSVAMWASLDRVLEAWEADDSVRAVILTGAGDKSFVSGADISEFEEQRGNAEAAREYERLASGGRARLAGFPKPIVARIRGFCLGTGLAIAMEADIRIASDDSQFGIPAARLGLAYEFPYVRMLTALTGPANAAMILFGGDRFGADEALRMGLVNRVVAPEELDFTSEGIARRIANNAPLTMRASKLAIRAAVRDAEDRDMEAVKCATEACVESADYREGRQAFLEKRTPRFTGR